MIEVLESLQAPYFHDLILKNLELFQRHLQPPQFAAAFLKPTDFAWFVAAAHGVRGPQRFHPRGYQASQSCRPPLPD